MNMHGSIAGQLPIFLKSTLCGQWLHSGLGRSTPRDKPAVPISKDLFGCTTRLQDVVNTDISAAGGLPKPNAPVQPVRTVNLSTEISEPISWFWLLGTVNLKSNSQQQTAQWFRIGETRSKQIGNKTRPSATLSQAPRMLIWHRTHLSSVRDCWWSSVKLYPSIQCLPHREHSPLQLRRTTG